MQDELWHMMEDVEWVHLLVSRTDQMLGNGQTIQ